MIDVFCVRIGNKYGPEYETYLENKLSKYCKIHWIRESYAPGVQLQWNKMLPMSFNTDKPVCVMDIDILLVNDYMEIFNYPIKRGEFLAMPDWWGLDHSSKGWKINGGFFKYYPTDCRPIWNEFNRDVSFWQRHFIDNGTTTGPVNGEQYFVEQMIHKTGLELSLLPKAWFTRWCSNKMHSMSLVDEEDASYKALKWQTHMTKMYREHTGNDYIYLGGEFHPDIKMVHFTNFMNKPHEWEDYHAFVGV